MQADERVVSWGEANYGGDCRAVRGQLEDVQHIYSAGYAFADVKADDSVVSWGAADYGGDCSAVREQLADVQHHLLHRLCF